VFDLYFRAGFGLLPDQMWGREKDPTRFVNLTRLLEGR
jgi:hypothetical protein